MRPLRFVALSEDGTGLVLAPDVPEAIDSGERFTLKVDDRLRAAVRGDVSRMGQIEIEIESQLRPREIQARIRAGQTPDAVAAAAGIRIERVMSYAHPVLQERNLIAQRAQQTRVKIDGSEAAPPTLIELLESRMLVGGIEDSAIEWDARRLESGTWEVSSTWQADERMITARWHFDTANSIIYPGNKDTVEMVEPKRSLTAVPTVIDDPALDEAPTGPIPLVRPSESTEQPERGRARRGRRRTPERDEETSLEQLFLTEEYDDASDPGATGNADRRPELHERDSNEPHNDGTGMPPVDGGTPELASEPAPHSAQSDTSVGDLDNDDPDEDGPDDGDPSSRNSDKKPRIPSWDDIVFGVKRRK